MQTKNLLVIIGIAFILGAALGGAGVYGIYSRQLAERDTELGELGDRYRELEQDYNIITGTVGDLTRLGEQRRELDRRTAEEVAGIRSAVGTLSIQGKSIEEKLRRIITALKEIESRTRAMENYSNQLRDSYYNSYNSLRNRYCY